MTAAKKVLDKITSYSSVVIFRMADYNISNIYVRTERAY